MVTEELLSKVLEKFQHGIRRHEIKETLMNEGYTETEIDAAIRKIQHDAMRRIPGISKIYHLIDHFESKPNITSPRMTLVLMAVCIGVLVILAVVLYVLFDPLGTRAVARDAQREKDASKIQLAVKSYYDKNHIYPNSLDNLTPEFLPSIPQDPQSGVEYAYKPLEGNTNYQLCIPLELQPVQCFSPKPITSDIPIVPTDTPVPTFMPKSGSGTSTSNAL